MNSATSSRQPTCGVSMYPSASWPSFISARWAPGSERLKSTQRLKSMPAHVHAVLTQCWTLDPWPSTSDSYGMPAAAQTSRVAAAVDEHLGEDRAAALLAL